MNNNQDPKSFIPFKPQVGNNLNQSVTTNANEEESIAKIEDIIPPKKSKTKIILTTLVAFLLLGSVAGAVFLVRQNQDVRKQAGSGSECFDAPQIYQPAPYEYKLGDTHSPNSEDWITYGIKDSCANAQILSDMFGPLDDLGNNVYITQPNQAFQYGFTFNRIVALTDYDSSQIQAGFPSLSEQELENFHWANKDTQSIEDCDKNGRQMVFDLNKKIAKPNGWNAWETGYYQIDITPKFQCGVLDQPSLGAGFIRITSLTTPTPTPTTTPKNSTPTPTKVPTGSPTPTIPLGLPTPTPTPTTPVISCQCGQIKAYDTTRKLLTSTDLAALKAGDKVRFTVTGTASSGTIDKSRFKINSGTYIESIIKKSATQEFYYEYTIPANVTSFSVEAQVHHAGLNQWF